MKQLTTLISALFFLVIGVSHVWALPACPSSGYFDNCYGTYVWEDGHKYVGDCQVYNKNGKGTYTYANGDKYVGDWKDDNKHGKGTYTYANGEKYVGEHKNDKRHGQGTYTWENGSSYTGTFVAGERTGEKPDCCYHQQPREYAFIILIRQVFQQVRPDLCSDNPSQSHHQPHFNVDIAYPVMRQNRRHCNH